ncbi:MAG: adenylyltransferase/cytidyltransferase family protein [archaeon]
MDALPAICRRLRSEGKRIVTANGSFDLMHAGHLAFLEEAARQGDVLVVGLNSDASIRSYKRGRHPPRPIIAEEFRAAMIAGLSCVDFVTIFDETVPLHFLEKVHPDVFCNGEEYGTDCIEAPLLKEMGAHLHLIPKYAGLSTSNILRKILRGR